jgi:hypothetical protein
MNNENSTPRKYKRYDAAFKLSAVLSSGKIADPVTAELFSGRPQTSRRLLAMTRQAVGEMVNDKHGA